MTRECEYPIQQVACVGNGVKQILSGGNNHVELFVGDVFQPCIAFNRPNHRDDLRGVGVKEEEGEEESEYFLGKREGM
jgi:hypothetical protein